MRLSRHVTDPTSGMRESGEFMKRKNALKCVAVAVLVTAHAVRFGSGHSDPQAGAAGEKHPISIEHRGRAVPNSLEEIADPTHTAVIVHEMVRDIVARYEPAQIERLLTPIQRILASAREKRVRIIYVRFTKHADGSTFSDPIRRLAFRGEPGAEQDTIEGTPGWEVIDAIKPHPEDLVLRKYRPDAFYGSILDSVLRWNGVKTVVLVGLGVAVGGIPTLATASNLGYFPVAVSDALISSDSMRTTDALAYVTDTSLATTHIDLLDAWKSAKARPLAVPPASRPAQDGPSSVMYEGREIPMTTEEILNPRHTAVVVQGIQNDFISPGGGCDARGCRYDRKQVATILPRIKEVIAAARNKNVPVVFLRTTSLPGDLTSSDVLRRQRTHGGGPQPALAVEGTRRCGVHPRVEAGGRRHCAAGVPTGRVLRHPSGSHPEVEWH